MKNSLSKGAHVEKARNALESSSYKERIQKILHMEMKKKYASILRTDLPFKNSNLIPCVRRKPSKI